MNYKDLIKNRRSIRKFKDEKIDQKIIDEILNDTCMAPSAMNKQPWRFIVIQDKKIMKKISDESKKNLLNMLETDLGSELKGTNYENILRNPDFNVFYNAPCLIIIAGKNNYHYFRGDCSLAANYLMFAATERKLGTCWIGLGANIQDADLKKEIGLPKDYEVVAPIIIGYPDQIIPTAEHNKPEILKQI